MATFRVAEREDRELLEAVMAEHHMRLCDAGVRVGLLYASGPRDEKSGLLKGPALKLHGMQALAVVKINSTKDRVEGKPDATVTLDFDQWPDHSPERKRAIMDHELAHLLLATDEDGNPQIDDANRPKLRMRQHDLVVGGFTDVVRRNKQHAAESDQFLEVNRFFTQEVFPWG